ncbi:hypothetical protein [Mesorhizobium sp. M0698]|uniref:hypothetical protein n=1 Tax=Mesorhizobium sp. M0698 TaxID=2956987 RepID=UPI003338238A
MNRLKPIGGSLTPGLSQCIVVLAQLLHAHLKVESGSILASRNGGDILDRSVTGRDCFQVTSRRLWRETQAIQVSGRPSRLVVLVGGGCEFGSAPNQAANLAQQG